MLDEFFDIKACTIDVEQGILREKEEVKGGKPKPKKARGNEDEEENNDPKRKTLMTLNNQEDLVFR